jgi:hypothetical protein
LQLCTQPPRKPLSWFPQISDSAHQCNGEQHEFLDICSASDNSATSYDDSTCDNGAATINFVTIIPTASAIFVVRISVTAIVPTAYNCPLFLL